MALTPSEYERSSEVLQVTYSNDAQVAIPANDYATAHMVTTIDTTGYTCVGLIRWYIAGGHRITVPRIGSIPPSMSNGSFSVDIIQVPTNAVTIDTGKFNMVFGFVKI